MKKMKKKFIYLIVFIALFGNYSCESTFLQMPDVSGSTDLTTVYSNSENAFSALMQCYHASLVQGLPPLPYWFGTLGNLTDELSRGQVYHAVYKLPDVGFQSNGLSSDNYVLNFTTIRANFLVAENIDKVPGMSATEKGYIKAEIAGLNAYRYMGMFMRYGGVSIVSKSFLPTENSAIPRSSLDSTLNYTLQLCNEAIAGLPDTWPENMRGRFTKGAAMAIKARVLTYAARPLFNSSTPYADNGGSNNLICFGNENSTRWNASIEANEAVLTWANQNGYFILNTGLDGANVPNKNAFSDYGTATSTPGNSEVLLAYKNNSTGASEGSLSYSFNYSSNQPLERFNCMFNGTLYNFFKNYYKADGNDQSWPQVGDAAPRPASDYLARIKDMEPRFLVDNMGPGFSAANNPGEGSWSVTNWGYQLLNLNANFPNGSYGYGCCSRTKFYYMAGSRIWFEMPLFRMAETYLTLAEAYNEVGNITKALQNLNVVHNRAGLPSITITDKDKLRALIQREWAIEFYQEGQRLYQVKHWKLANIGTEILGGPVMEFQWKVNGDANTNVATSLINYWNAVTYSKYWNKKMFLDPIPQTETNKGIAIQNPGY